MSNVGKPWSNPPWAVGSRPANSNTPQEKIDFEISCLRIELATITSENNGLKTAVWIGVFVILALIGTLLSFLKPYG